MYDDELYDDLDEDIKSREALIEEAKKLDVNLTWNEVSKDVSDLKRKWKRIQYWDSEFEDKLSEEFDRYLDVFYAKRKEDLGSSKKIKEDLIQQAIELSKANNFNRATQNMHELMSEWKNAGNAGKEIDDELWASFNEARQVFFDRKNENWEVMKEKRGQSQDIKKELIEEAAALSDSEEWAKASNEYRTLMNRWKEAGHAGKEVDDGLWNAFQENRQKFYDRREVHYESMRDQQAIVYDAKKALVEQAQAIDDTKNYAREHTARMKELHVEWKKAGSCGKDKDDQIWDEFKTIMDHYFAGLKQMNEQKHAQWLKNMSDMRNRKQEMINNQKRQIRFMQNEIIGLIGERAILDMEEDIKEAEEFIQELEQEIIDIDKKIQS